MAQPPNPWEERMGPPPKRSLAQVGCVLVLAGIILGVGLRNLGEWVFTNPTLRNLLLLLSDIFNLLVFVGLVLLAVALLRKWHLSQKSKRRPAPPGRG